jgi:hypothetical protein
MAASTIALLSNSLKTTYSPKYWAAMQNAYTPIISDLEECPDEPILGNEWQFEFHLGSPLTARLNAEGGSIDTFRQRLALKGTVNSCEIINGFQITEMLKNAGKGAGAFGNELDRHTTECMEDTTMLMQRLFTISHGTGRLAQVDSSATSGAVNTFYAKKSAGGVVALMENEYIEFYTTDTGGTIVGTNARQITAINTKTLAVTFDGAAIDFATTDSGVYKIGSYGKLINGLRGLNDDGTYGLAIHGQTRASYPQLKCQIRDAGGALSEELMRNLSDDIMRIGGQPDRIITNVGGANAFLSITDGDRRYNMERGKTAQRTLGYKKSDLLFSYHDGNLPFNININVPGGEMNFVTWKRFHKFTNRKLGWLEGGDGILHLTPVNGGYSTSHTAIVCAQVNIGNTAPRWGGRLQGFIDKSVNNDS